MNNHKIRKAIALMLCVTVFMGLSTIAAFAEDGTDAKSTSKVEAFNDAAAKEAISQKLKEKTYVYDDPAGDWITWNRAYNFTLYRGEKLYVDFDMWDTYSEVYTIPSFDVYDAYDDWDYLYTWSPAGSYWTVDVDSYNRYTGYHNINSKSLPVGKYYIALAAMPCDVYGWWVDDLDTYDIPTEYIDFYIRDLPKPTSLKAKAGKKKVTVTYKKAGGATKYEIYRSTKKNSGYKKIATTTKNKYVDKKVKKKKKYYYKVRAVRSTGAGVAYSGLTAQKRSGKVK